MYIYDSLSLQDVSPPITVSLLHVSTTTVAVQAPDRVILEEITTKEDTVADVAAWVADYTNPDEYMTFIYDIDYGPFEYDRGWSDGYPACMADIAGKSHQSNFMC